VSSWLQNGDVLCFLWGTKWIYICYVEGSRSPLWSSGQSSWLQIERSGFDSCRYQIFWEVVRLERASLSLVSTTEKLLERKSSGSGLENRKYGLGIRYANHVPPSSPKVDTNFADKRRSLGRYSSFVQKHNEHMWTVVRPVQKAGHHFHLSDGSHRIQVCRYPCAKEPLPSGWDACPNYRMSVS
jgi:hypothetical protein